MNVLLLGGGAREHAMAWSISKSPLLSQLFISPGNGGTHGLATHAHLSSDFGEIVDFVHQHTIGMIIVGPEVPLVNGIVDYVQQHAADVLIIGPNRVGAQLEGSKDFAKRFMIDEGIPTASYHTITKGMLTQGYQVLEDMSPPYVLKADGLAAGKGVIITSDLAEAKEVLREMLDGQFGEASARVVIESFLTGMEFSVFALVDGSDYVILPIAKDYKRVGEGDTGPNTGGMGSISPVDFVDDVMRAKVEECIIKPTIEGLKKRSIKYHGFIFFGLINCDGDPHVIEYNCRLGDPETQVVLPRLNNDFLELCIKAAQGNLSNTQIQVDERYMANVVLASRGYPVKYQKGIDITISEPGPDTLFFHAGTSTRDGQLITNGGRVISSCAYGSDLITAINNAYHAVEQIDYSTKMYRLDIGRDLSLL